MPPVPIVRATAATLPLPTGSDADDPRLGLVTRMAVALHAAGLPSHRLELATTDIAAALGLQVQVLALPTALWVATGPEGQDRVTLQRVEPGDIDLARLVELDGLARAIAAGGVDVVEARRRLDAIRTMGPAWSVGAQLAAWAASSAAAAVLFGGSPRDLVLAGALGSGVGLLSRVLAGRPHAVRGLLVMAAFGVAFIARIVAQSGLGVSPGVVTVAALVVLLPGYSFTIGMVELGSGHLVSGVARTAAAGISLMLLVLGVALGGGLAGGVNSAGGGSLPWFAEVLALAVAPLGFGVLLGARRQDLGLVLVAAAVGVGAARVGDMLGTSPTGAFVGALTLGVFGSLVARRMQRPTALTLVPGVLLLVPGSVGFRSLVALLGGDVLAGVDHAFQMVLTAAALAAGLVLAPSLLPAPRAT